MALGAGLAFAAGIPKKAAARLPGQKSIRDVAFVDLLGREVECTGSTKIDHLAFADLTGDGVEEALIVASTCLAGTGGPDVHAVYTLDPEGRPKELEVPEPEKHLTENVFGNANWTLSADQGALVARYSDTSERSEPLVVRYRWNGKRFAVESAKESELFKTSYDCLASAAEVERAICRVKRLAEADLKLAEKLQGLKGRLSAEAFKRTQEAQGRWLELRGTECPIYKFWVDCLAHLYFDRSRELDGVLTAPPAAH